MLDRDDPWDPWGGSRGLRTWFLSTRTVSRQFNLITTKLVFQVLELSERNVIGEDPPRGYAQFKASKIRSLVGISTYTLFSGEHNIECPEILYPA